MLMQIGIDKLLKGAEGLCGFDIFYNSIVEMSHSDRTLSLYDPSAYEAQPRAQKIPWQVLIHISLCNKIYIFFLLFMDVISP